MLQTLSTTHRIVFDYDCTNHLTNKYYGAAHKNTGTSDVKYFDNNALGMYRLLIRGGKVRSGGTIGTQTTMNFTGQKLDSTGLLNYNARLYDPTVGRFVSPDSSVPGALRVGGALGTSNRTGVFFTSNPGFPAMF